MLFEIAVCINKKRLFEHFYKGKHRIYRNSKNLRKERQKTSQMNTEKTKQKVIKKSTNPKQDLPIFGTSQGIRTPVTAVRGRCPRPLDQGGIWLRNKDSNLNNTSQSRRCYRYTIPHRFNAVYYNKALFICQAKILFPRCRFSPKN